MRSGVRSREINHKTGPGHVTPVVGENKTKQSLKKRSVGKFPIDTALSIDDLAEHGLTKRE